MMSKFYPLKTLLIPLLLCGILSGAYSQTLDLSKSVTNITTGLSGLTAAQNDILEYTIVARNLSGTNITSARLFDNIPAGVTYVANSTTLNGVSIADVSGKMPFSGTGGLINSPLYGPGTLAPNVSATITFQVKVTANGGNVTNYGTLQGTHTSGTIIQNTNTVFTNLTPDTQCSTIYESTATNQSGIPTAGFNYKVIRTMSTTNGKALTTVFDATVGSCYSALDSTPRSTGSVLRYASAIAFDKVSNRIYFINNYTNNPPEDLCYVDLNYSPARAFQYFGYPLENNTTPGYNINRMAFASDGYGYAITSNSQDLIRFSINPSTHLPVITSLGPLINDVNNAPHDIFGPTEGGGDIFGDGSGMLYMVVNSSNMYKINPNTRVATYLGTLNPTPNTSSNSIAIDATGTVYIGGAYQNVYKVNLATMAATSIVSGPSGVYTNGDFTSCAFPVLAPALTANKTYRNINGSQYILGGDTVEYTIEVTNTGNINAANVKLYDSIPSASLYIVNSTKLNGSAVPDVSGVMPYSVVGGKLINSPGESPGILRPGSANKATVTFQIKVDPLHLICNQSRITLLDGDGNVIFINSDDPSQSGSQNSTCFFTDGVLPVNNFRFRGSLNNNLSVLQWTGSDEENVVSYEVQYSVDGTNFSPIGSIPAKGNGNYNNNYEFTDMANTRASNRLYRLKVILKGGSTTYSTVIRLSLKGNGDIQIQPNPFEKDLNLQFQLKTAESVRIRLIDFSGREVFTTTEKLSVGNHSIPLILPSGLSKGMYVLELLEGNNRLYQKKLLKR